jgi:hypothetical protein
MRGVDDAAARSMKKVDINKLMLDDLFVELHLEASLVMLYPKRYHNSADPGLCKCMCVANMA